MDPNERCPFCDSECVKADGNIMCEKCKATIFIQYDEWGSESFFKSDAYKKFILSSMATNMQEDSRQEQEDLLRRETYSRTMLENDNLETQTDFPETLDLIMNSYHKYKKAD